MANWGGIYAQANLGRGAGDKRLSDADWRALQLSTRGAIVAYLRSLGAEGFSVETHTGAGSWDGWGTKGAELEDSAHISAYAPRLSVLDWQFDAEGRVDNTALERLHSALGYIAQRYGQDAIALIVTDSTLITQHD